MIDPARPRPQRSMPPTRRGEGMTGSRLSGLPSQDTPPNDESTYMIVKCAEGKVPGKYVQIAGASSRLVQWVYVVAKEDTEPPVSKFIKTALKGRVRCLCPVVKRQCDEWNLLANRLSYQ